MSDAGPQELGLLPKLVIAFAMVLIAAGVLWHGVTFAVIARIWRNLLDRPSGPMSFRFILQPSMAAIAAIRDDLNIVRTGHGASLWAVAHDRNKRIALLREGLNATARIILLGLAMDLIYQLLAFETFHPAEALIIALLLAFVPYLLIRVLFKPIVRRLRKTSSAGDVR